jgi:predicted small lipoprotein YifL
VKALVGSIAAASILVAIAGCGARTPYQMSDQDKQRFVDVARVARGGGNAPLIFGISDCTVYKAVTKDQQIVDWRVILRSDWGQQSYPKFMTACVDEHLKYSAPYVLVDMCARAIGAGGGCNGGGTYRSRDGERWQIQGNSLRWYPLPK